MKKAAQTDDPFVAKDAPKMASGRAALSKFKPWPGNPRTHPQAEIELLASILKLRGFDQPIVVDENWWILKGHGRLSAALLASLSDAPYVRRFGLSENEKRAMRIEDNQIALLAGWDVGLLKQDTETLQSAGYDMTLLGFGETELAGFFEPLSPAAAGDSGSKNPANSVSPNPSSVMS